MSAALRALALSATLILAACATRLPEPPPPAPAPAPAPAPTPAPPPVPPPPATAREAGITLASPVELDPARAARALEAFKLSCPALVRRTDQSGLTQSSDWRPLCTEAASLAPANAAAFFRDRFDWARVARGEAFATGYYEPEIIGSRTQATGYDVPVYSKPDDLVRCYGPAGTGRGRVDHEGYCVLYYTRAEIEDGALQGRELELGWAADPIELFFLQIQGSGRLKLPDGQVMRIGYADQNGREYVGIGRLLRDRGILPSGGASMDAIIAWMRTQPDGGKALMRENPSYIFFKELTGPGPLGALNVAVSPQTTVAADPKFVPLGAPVFLKLDRPEASGLWVAQDTGGAIKGANRFDTFWGHGEAARRTAGGMSAKGNALILLPKGVVARAQPVP